jgi:hypothetical protein
VVCFLCPRGLLLHVFSRKGDMQLKGFSWKREMHHGFLVIPLFSCLLLTCLALSACWCFAIRTTLLTLKKGLPRASSLIQCFLWHPTTPYIPMSAIHPSLPSDRNPLSLAIQMPPLLNQGILYWLFLYFIHYSIQAYIPC